MRVIFFKCVSKFVNCVSAWVTCQMRENHAICVRVGNPGVKCNLSVLKSDAFGAISMRSWVEGRGITIARYTYDYRSLYLL